MYYNLSKDKVHRTYKKYSLLFISLIALSVLITSCSETTDPDDNSKAGIFKGAAQNVGNGTAYSWVELDAMGYPVKFGFTMTESSLEGLGEEMTETILTMPTQASMTNVKMIAVDWNPGGHEPPGVYDLPHFDFHFYMIDMDFRLQITAVGDDTLKCNKQPMDGYLPVGYLLPPGGVPTMGAHAIDLSSPEFNGGIFSETFIYGYYDGNMIFYEPMVTNAYLMGKDFSEKTLKTPAKYPKDGYYPSKMKIEFDETKKEYKIILSGMIKYTM